MSTQGKAAPALGHLAGLGKPLIVLRRAEPVSGLLTVLANQLAQELTGGLLIRLLVTPGEAVCWSRGAGNE
jgi:hypothetical protein